MMKQFSLFVFVIFTPLLFSGCIDAFKATIGQSVQQAKQKAKQQTARSAYRPFAQAFHNFHDVHRRAPSGWDELITFAQKSGGNLAALASLQSSGVTVHWGISIRDAVIGSSNFVLLYGPQARTGGGPVLMMDGAVINMNASMLQEHLRAQADIRPRSRTVAAPSKTPTTQTKTRSSIPPTHTPPSISSTAILGQPAADDAAVDDSAPGVPVGKDTLIKTGDQLFARWATSWEEVKVLDVLADDRIKIRWINWGSDWDEVVAREGLRVEESVLQGRLSSSPSKTPFAKNSRSKENEESFRPNPELVFGLRTWTSAGGAFKTRARLIEYVNGKVTLRRQDGKQLEIPLEKISVTDQRYVLEKWLSE